MPKNRASPRVFIWDLDDTLIWTSWAYSRAFAKFHEYMSQLFDYRLLELRTLGTISEEIDKALIKTVNPDNGKPYGYGMDRFPMSLVETYKWLCEHGFGKYHEMVARRVKLIGMVTSGTLMDPTFGRLLKPVSKVFLFPIILGSEKNRPHQQKMK